MMILGMTGSVATGKSTTAKMFAGYGVRVYDADAAVHKLYRGRAVPEIESAFPGSTSDGVVDRAALSRIIMGDKAAFERLEAVVHPMVREERSAFLAASMNDKKQIVLLDIPLLFETDGDKDVDAVIVVTCSPEIQRARALSREDMTEEKFEAIKMRQMADREKRSRAHFLVDSSFGMDSARHQVAQICRAVAGNGGHVLRQRLRGHPNP